MCVCVYVHVHMCMCICAGVCSCACLIHFFTLIRTRIDCAFASSELTECLGRKYGLYRRYFGVEHMDAIVAIVGADLPLIVTELLNNMVNTNGDVCLVVVIVIFVVDDDDDDDDVYDVDDDDNVVTMTLIFPISFCSDKNTQ